MSTKVLTLNASFVPLTVVSMKRAIILVLDEKAEVVHDTPVEWHSATSSVRLPSVIRLVRYVKIPYRKNIKLTRSTLYARDKGRCAYCDVYIQEIYDGTIDHVHPRSKGGKHTWENTVFCCKPCNFKKGDKSLEQMGWSLKFKPYVPTNRAWIIIGCKARNIQEDWVPYLESLSGGSFAEAAV